MKSRVCVAVLMSFAMASTSLALDINGSTGEVTSWGVTPFSVAGPSSGSIGSMAYTLENDYAPICYPSGVGYVPSPGLSAGGETIDLEEIYLRVDGDQMKVLVVTSTQYAAEFSGTNYYLGDLFLTVGGQDYAVVTQSASQGLAAGSVYSLSGPGDWVQLQSGSRSYAGSTTVVNNDYGAPGTVPEIAGPWAVDGGISVGQLEGAATLDVGTHDYGGSEDGTFLIEYTLDASLVGVTPTSNVSAHITWGCGNDVIEIHDMAIPEPASMALLGLGLGAMAVGKVRSKRR